jgi:pyridoxal phosphate enzyme (YggS family)
MVILPVKDKLQWVREYLNQCSIESGRSQEDIQLIAVSKTKPVELIIEAFEANQIAFGENIVQEALRKIEALKNYKNIEWHLIGHLQKNKLKFCPGNFQWIHSIDSSELAKKLEDRCVLTKHDINVLIQVNLSQEKSKYGVQDWDDLLSVAETLHKGQRLKLRGLMTIPAPDLGEAATRKIFTEQEGATMIRLGTAIFGTR